MAGSSSTDSSLEFDLSQIDLNEAAGGLPLPPSQKTPSKPAQGPSSPQPKVNPALQAPAAAGGAAGPAPAKGKANPALQGGTAAPKKANTALQPSATAATSKPAPKAPQQRPATAPNGSAAKPAAEPRASKKPPAEEPPPEAEALDEAPTSAVEALKRYAPPMLVSMVVHMVLLLVLGLVHVATEVKTPPPSDLIAAVGQENPPTEEVVEVPVQDLNVPQEVEPVSEPVPDTPIDVSVNLNTPVEASMPSVVDEVFDSAISNPQAVAAVAQVGDGQGNGELSGQRGTAGRQMRVFLRGGNSASEEAVALGLRWLAAHQLPDGGWSLDHGVGECNGRCGDPGRLVNARIAATALGVLPFLGAGHTHKKGAYQKTVQGGLSFIVNAMKSTPNGGDLSAGGGSLYSQGLATIALCEAYAMSKDRSLLVPCQQAITYIEFCQDPMGGGWRYTPRQPGDTSVVGWQLMALKSAHLSYLKVNEETIKKAVQFLDHAQADGGATYGYTDPAPAPNYRPATTAIGLLCRMYLGMKQDDPILEKGVQLLSKRGPDKNNMYYNYYATQVLHHYEGETWEKWNFRMRDYLIETQAREGHTTGSWSFHDGHASEAGGRLYNTALAVMTLEIYYRHMPIYGKESHKSTF